MIKNKLKDSLLTDPKVMDKVLNNIPKEILEHHLKYFQHYLWCPQVFIEDINAKVEFKW